MFLVMDMSLKVKEDNRLSPFGVEDNGSEGVSRGFNSHCKERAFQDLEVVFIDPEEVVLQPALSVLEDNYITRVVRDLSELNLKNQVNDQTLFIIDPNSFGRRALSVYEQLLSLGANLIVSVYPDESIITESECLDQGVLDFIKKPISPGTISYFIDQRMSFVGGLRKRALATADFINVRRDTKFFSRDWTIDLVEDSKIDAKVLRQILPDNCDVRWFSSSEKFYVRDESVFPDLFILDLSISGRDEGFELIRSIKCNPIYQDIPVLLLTGSWQRRKVATGLAIGADDYIKKWGAADDAILSRIITKLVMSWLNRIKSRNELLI